MQVAIYKDRVEIRNPGGLYGGITIEDLRKGHISKRRNPLIADLFRRIEMVEAWGRGMPLILKHEPGVRFQEIADIFIAAFGRPSFKSGFIEENIPAKSSVKSSSATGKTMGKGSAGRLSKMVSLIKGNPDITMGELAQKTGVTTRTIERNIVELQNNGTISRVGSRKSGKWVIIKSAG